MPGCMECCLHILYKLRTETWQARSDEDKAEVKRKKAEVQQKLKERLGLVVDIPKSGGSGTSRYKYILDVLFKYLFLL